MKTIYYRLFTPIATYVAAGWINKIVKHTRTKFKIIHRQALLRVTGAYKIASKEAMTVLAGSPPVTIEAERWKLLYRVRRNLPI